MSYTSLTLAALLVALGPTQDREPRPREFWKAIVDGGFAVPEGESAYELIVELSEHLGSRDSELRDDFGYGIPAAWIYRERKLDDTELRALVELWSANLERGIGSLEDDTVLLRSFSVLDLSLAVAADNREPFLDRESFDALLDRALRYLERERDLRGWEEGVGWLHSAAHTADLLKFLARSKHLQPDGQYRILVGIAQRLRDTKGYVFVHGEDERLVAAVTSILVREDFDEAAFEEFLGGLTETKATGPSGRFDPVAFAGLQNTKNFLRALFVQLSRAKLPEKLVNVRDDVLEALGAL